MTIELSTLIGTGLVMDGVTDIITPDFGTAAGKVAQGDDSRFTDSRAPTGSAGGDLSGTYPNPAVAKITTTSGPTSLTVGAITDTQILTRSGTSIVGVAAAAGAVGLGSVTNDAQLKRAAGDFSSFTNKASPTTSDVLLIEDAAAAGAKKYVTISALPAAAPATHAASHLPGGSDALTTAAAGTIAPDDTAAVGAAASFARSDHRHAITCAAASAVSVDGSNAEGSASSFARSDHTHAVLQKYTFFADQLDIPATADWAVNSLAAAQSDTNNSGLTARIFVNATEDGVGMLVQIPLGATNMVIGIVSRAETATGSTQNVIARIYVREFPDNGAVESWSAGTDLTAISIPNSELWQYDSQTIALADLSLVTGRIVQIEFTRRGADANDTLTSDWAVLLLSVGFT